MSLDARHRQQDPLRTGVERDLKRLRKVLDRDDVAAEAHAPQNHELGLDRLAEQTAEQSATKPQGSSPS